ncbi:hypothetical protein L596_012262 [Steinernema carpocapsae]|uniref:protein-serine/threonine phosphatase n=1 Tax=Steinernema carpocapsae TaxID=34508 RepID=A0A4U5NWR5_STECR|nr:hypothetical protein L596_012262 [Steinernema carpocapsae]
MFSFMPLAVNVGGKILCVHGGPSPLLEEIEDIEQIPRPLTEYDNKRMSSHLLFSEATPDVEKNAFETKKYGRGLTFGPTAVEDTCKKLNISLIIRSHNSIPGGYFMQSEGKLLSIFSAPGDPGCVKGACAVVENDFSVKIVRLAVHGQLRAPTVGDSLQTVEKKVEIYIDDPSMAETTLEKNTSTIEKVVSLEKTVGKTVE